MNKLLWYLLLKSSGGGKKALQYMPAVPNDTATYPMKLVNLFSRENGSASKEGYGSISVNNNVTTLTKVYEGTTYFKLTGAFNEDNIQTDFRQISSQSDIDTLFYKGHTYYITLFEGQYDIDVTNFIMSSRAGYSVVDHTTGITPTKDYSTVWCYTSHPTISAGEHTLKFTVTEGYKAPVYVDGDGAYYFVKDIKNNVFGYYNPLTETFVEVEAEGEVIQPIASVTNGASSNFDSEVNAVQNIEMYVRVKAISGSFYLLQARATGSGTIYGISGSQAGDTITTFAVASSISRTEGHIYTIKLTLVGRAFTLYVKDENTGEEDTKTGTADVSTYPFPSPSTVKLFGDASKISAGVTVYDVNIKINGEYVWQPVPVRVGTTIEMFDRLNWKFASKTGTFTGGEDVPWEW